MIRMNTKQFSAAVLACSLGFVSSHALAIPVTLVGTTVSFTFDDALAGLFGTPAVSGDSLFFTPTQFKAQSSSGAGFVTASQTFNVAVTANAGYQISAANLTESGDYYNINTNFTGFEGVAIGGQFILRDLGVPLAPAVIDGIAASAPLTVTTSFPVGFTTTNWSAVASAAVLPEWSGNAVNVTIENILIASSLNTASAAFIEKKFVGLDVVTTPVPEPETYALLLAGLGLIGYVARRRRLV